MKKYAVLFLVLALAIIIQSALPATTLFADTTNSTPVSTDSTSVNPSATTKPTPTPKPAGLDPAVFEYYSKCENHTHGTLEEALIMAEHPGHSLWVVICRKLNVRPTPSTKLAPIDQLERGQTVLVLNIEDGWAKIWHDDQIAYVCSKYITQVTLD